MKMKVVLITAMVIFAAIGIFAIAADYGTQNDPLVSLSYITDVFAPNLLKQAENISKDTASQANIKISDYEARVDKKVNEFMDRNTASVDSSMINQIVSKVPNPATKQTAPFATVSLAAGKTLVLTKGCEVLVRSGTTVCNAGSLIDMTTGGLVSPKGSISANHLYIAPEAGATISAKANATILVKGQYSTK